MHLRELTSAEGRVFQGRDLFVTHYIEAVKTHVRTQDWAGDMVSTLRCANAFVTLHVVTTVEGVEQAQVVAYFVQPTDATFQE